MIIGIRLIKFLKSIKMWMIMINNREMNLNRNINSWNILKMIKMK